MIALLVAAVSGRASASTSGCPPLELAWVPAAEMVVPHDPEFTVVASNLELECPPPRLSLRTEQGTPLPTVTEMYTWGVFQMHTEEFLDLGERYVFAVEDPSAPASPIEVLVVAGVPDPVVDRAPAVALEVEHRCDDVRVDVAARAETRRPVTGVWIVDYDIDGTTRHRFVPTQDQTVLEDRSSHRDGAEVCVSTHLADLSGAVVWSSERTCSEVEPCPTYGPPEEVSATFEAICGGPTQGTRIVADVDLPPGNPSARGELVLEATTSLGDLGPAWSEARFGPEGDAHVEVVVPGGHDVCFELALVRTSGEEAWRVGPWCSEEALVCPGVARPVDEAGGCGCGGRRPFDPIGAALALGALVRAAGRRGARAG